MIIHWKKNESLMKHGHLVHSSHKIEELWLVEWELWMRDLKDSGRDQVPKVSLGDVNPSLGC